MLKKILTIIITVFALIGCNNNQNNEQINANQNEVINPFTTNANGRINSKGISREFQKYKFCDYRIHEASRRRKRYFNRNPLRWNMS